MRGDLRRKYYGLRYGFDGILGAAPILGVALCLFPLSELAHIAAELLNVCARSAARSRSERMSLSCRARISSSKLPCGSRLPSSASTIVGIFTPATWMYAESRPHSGLSGVPPSVHVGR